MPKETALAVCSPGCQYKQCLASHLSPSYQQVPTYASEADEKDCGQKDLGKGAAECLVQMTQSPRANS